MVAGRPVQRPNRPDALVLDAPDLKDSPSRPHRPGPTNVIARLQALFPTPPLSSDQTTPPIHPRHAFDGGQPSSPKHPPAERQFLKIRIMTWNMHDSLPKGDLAELLGDVSLATTSSDKPNRQGGTLSSLGTDNNHPYHIVVVAGQEVPSVSGIPMALGAGFKLKDKERDKSKDREKDERDVSNHIKEHQRSKSHHGQREADHESQHFPDPERLHSSLSLRHHEHESRRRKKHESDLTSLHTGSHPPAGWSSVLEGWYAEPGATNLHRSKSLVEAISPRLADHIMPAPATPRPNVDQHMQTGPYELLVKERMMGLYLAVYINHDIKGLVEGTSKSAVTAGLIGGRVGNKGGVGVSMKVAGTTLLFVNAHLAAHEGKVHHRLADLAKIKAELSVDDFLGNDDPRVMAEDITDKFDHSFIFGDLNFRLDITRLHADWLISRKDYAQALAFDQLRKVMQSGDAFVGFREAEINFPPTFKYDVLRSLKRPKLRGSYSLRHSQHTPLDSAQHEKLLSEIEEKEKERAAEDEDDDDDDDDEDEGGEDATSMVSSMWASTRSRYTTDGDGEFEEDERESFLASPPTRNSSSGAHKMWAAAAVHRAKSKWVSLLSNSAPGTPNRSKHSLSDALAPRLDAKRASRAASSLHSVDGPSHVGPSLSVTPEIVVGLASPSSTALAVIEAGEPEERGVYDSSHKQRVPSWCDRILWKSTVEPESDDEEPEVGETLPPRTRMAQFLHVLRPMNIRNRKDSQGSSVEVSPIGPALDAVMASFSQDKDNHRELPSSPARPSLSSQQSPRRSTDTYPAAASPVPLTRSWSHADRTPESSAARAPGTSVPLVHAKTMSPAVPANWSDVPTVPAHAHLDTPPPTPPPAPASIGSRWRGFVSLLHRDAPHAATTSQASLVEPHTDPRRGDVVCLGYDTLDDRGMRRLEGRSDHRPVIGSYAIYI